LTVTPTAAAVVGLVLALVLVSSVSNAAPVTGKSAAPVHPSNRWGPNMVYDAKDGYVLLFGGSTNQNYTWAFSDGKWTNLDLAVAPPSRAHGGIAYDAADGYIVLFGGSNAGRFYNDTWEYAGGVWKNVSASAGQAPSPRVAMGMAYDAADGYIVLFGGMTKSHQTLNDTWKFAHGKWANVTGTTGATPLSRFAEGMAYDAADDYVLMYGGWTATKGQNERTLDDTWEFSGGLWKLVSPTTNPGPRWFVDLTYDSTDGYILFFEGINDSGVKSYWNTPPYTWTYLHGVWTNVTNASDAPSHRFAEGLADDPADHYVVMFGGLNSTAVVAHALSDTWTYKSGVWTNITKTA